MSTPYHATDCARTAPAHADPVWIKATRSIPNGACVEVAAMGEYIALRDSKRPDVAPFRFTQQEMEAFIDGAKRGEFDHLVARD